MIAYNHDVCVSPLLDSLRGVETKVEVVGAKSQKLELPGYGFYMEFPDGALPPGVTADVGVRIILAGQFKLPAEAGKLITAIYWISASEVFVKEVAVNIQHCAVIRSDKETSKFRFIIGEISQKELPYRFQEREGVFNPHTQFATIKLKQFSLVGAVAPEGTELCYTTLQFYKQIPRTVNMELTFAIVCNLEPVLKVKYMYLCIPLQVRTTDIISFFSMPSSNINTGS